MLLPTLLPLVSALLCAAQSVPAADANLDPNALDTYANNSLFLRWRPRYHFLAPAGHMNDPCGPMYDNVTDTYHLFYQSFPNHVQGGNGSWGHATSKDLISWVEPSGWRDTQPLVLQPGPYPEYDWIGDWSGSAQPVSLASQYDGNLTAMFTCVKRFPVGWTLDEQRGSEQVCMATSADGGLTWQKYSGNPIMNDPPAGWNFTGWRDPYFHPMPEVDALLGTSGPHYYLVMGSGIHGAGGRMPLYTAKASDLTTWTYLGALFEVPGNLSWGGDPFRTGSLGFNFELAGFNSMVEDTQFGGDGKKLHYVLNMGTEGGNNSYHQNNHWSMFGLGSASARSNGSVAVALDVTAPLDWGNLYAATTFLDSKNNRRVLWGWSDEDMNGYGIKPQGFQGSLGLPRELFIYKAHNVSLPADGNTTAWPAKWEESTNGLYSVTTLGSRPLPDVVKALHAGKPSCSGREICVSGEGSHSLNATAGQHFHLSASMKVSGQAPAAGFVIRASPNMEEYTRIVYTPANDTITLDRGASTLAPNFTTVNYQAFFQPLTINGAVETVHFDIFVDGSLVEIFINDRFALTSRVYPTRADAVGVSLFASQGQATFQNVELWTDMLDVFPERPLNSSSPLHYDPYYDTHITFAGVDGMPVGTQLYDGY